MQLQNTISYFITDMANAAPTLGDSVQGELEENEINSFGCDVRSS
jgi:hypothetical protein